MGDTIHIRDRQVVLLYTIVEISALYIERQRFLRPNAKKKGIVIVLRFKGLINTMC